MYGIRFRVDVVFMIRALQITIRGYILIGRGEVFSVLAAAPNPAN